MCAGLQKSERKEYVIIETDDGCYRIGIELFVNQMQVGLRRIIRRFPKQRIVWRTISTCRINDFPLIRIELTLVNTM